MILLAKILNNRQAIGYFLFSIVSTAAALIKLLLFAELLGSTSFAYYSLFDIVAAYGLYLGTMGLLDGPARLIPVLRGSDKIYQANYIASLASSWQLMLSFGILLTYFLFLIITRYFSEVDLPFSILVFAGIFAFANNLYSMGLMILISTGHKTQFSYFIFYKNMCCLVIGVIFGNIWGLPGIIVSEILVSLSLGIFIYLRILKIPLCFFSNYSRGLQIARSGFPLMLNSVFQNLTRNAERIMIGASLGLFVFGQYSFSIVIFTVGIAIQNIISQYLNPNLCYLNGKDDNLKSSLGRVDRLLLISIVLSILCYPLFILVTDYISSHYLESYSIGFSLMKIMYFGAILQLGQIYQGFLIARGQSRILNIHSIVLLLISIILCSFGYFKHLSAEYYSLVFVANRFLSLVFLRVTVERRYFVNTLKYAE